MLQGHGDDGDRCGNSIRANFSSNVRRDDPLLEELGEHLSSVFPSVARYPEVLAESLAVALAEAEGVHPENILITNGATAAIYLIAQAFRGLASCVIVPTFAEYEDAVVLHRHRVSFASRRQFEEGDIPGADLIWFCNPNNPTGAVVSRQALLQLVDQSGSSNHIIDTAYQDLCDAPPLLAIDARARENLVLLKSFAKLFPIPGLRLGYVVASAARIRRLRRHSSPWSVNTLAIAAGRFLLPHRARLAAAALSELPEAQYLREQITALPGLRAHPSATPFFLVEMERKDSARLKMWLIAQHGLLIRDAANFRGLDGRYLRVAAQTPRENRWLVEALTQWIHSS